jgi:hypothetical protein
MELTVEELKTSGKLIAVTVGHLPVTHTKIGLTMLV